MKKRARLLGSSLVLVVMGLAAVVACSDQGEGERCELENGDSDCGSGLICVAGSAGRPPGRWSSIYQTGLNEGFRGVDRCCPETRAEATHPACVQLTTGPGDSAPPPDTGPLPGVGDAAPDADVPDASEPEDAGIQDASDDADAE